MEINEKEFAIWLAEWFEGQENTFKCNYTCIEDITDVCLDGDWNIEKLARDIIKHLETRRSAK